MTESLLFPEIVRWSRLLSVAWKQFKDILFRSRTFSTRMFKPALPPPSFFIVLFLCLYCYLSIYNSHPPPAHDFMSLNLSYALVRCEIDSVVVNYVDLTSLIYDWKEFWKLFKILTKMLDSRKIFFLRLSDIYIYIYILIYFFPVTVEVVWRISPRKEKHSSLLNTKLNWIEIHKFTFLYYRIVIEL